MRRGVLVLACLVSLILVAGSLPAAAYVDRGHDPDDADMYDIRSTVRLVDRDEQGRFLKVRVRIYDGELGRGAYVGIGVPLDTDGGRAYEAVLGMSMSDMEGPPRCSLTSRSGHPLADGRIRFPNGAASCRVPLRPLHPTKAIRWSASTTYEGVLMDVAPDVGMYG